MNCTFTTDLFGLILRDDCSFKQSRTDKFDWSFGNTDTSTPNTGPSADRSKDSRGNLSVNPKSNLAILGVIGGADSFKCGVDHRLHTLSYEHRSRSRVGDVKNLLPA